MSRASATPTFRAPGQESPIGEALRLCATHLRYAMLFSALVNIAYLAPTLYMLGVYDMVLPSGSELTLSFVTIALVLTLVTLTSLDRIRQRILAAASVRLDHVFSARIFRRALLAGASPQPRVNQTLRDFDMIRAAATGPAALAMFDAPWIPIYIAVCFFLHPAIGSLALGGALVLMALAVWNERATQGLSDRALQANAASFAAQDAAGGSAEVIRSLGMTEAFVARFKDARAAANRPQQQAAQAGGRIGGLIRFLRLFLQSIALGLGAWLAIHKSISAGAIFASSMLAARALSPIDQIVAQWRTVSQAISAYRAVRTQAAAEPERASTLLPAPAPRLQVASASVLSPARDRTLLREVSFAAEGGQVVGVIGPSGAGKSTLLQLLANARSPDQGEVRLDGARFADWDSRRLGRFIGYLPQDSALFPGTVKDNISRFEQATGADPEEVDASAVAAARAAGAHELILALPNGYDTLIGARGRGLSAGQQQRVALARALYGEPVLFVLDEPDAHLDAEGEQALAAAIGRLRARGALVVIAAHRTNLIAGADLLLVLRGGRVDKFGPRQAVLEAMRAAEPGRPGPPAAAPGPTAPAPAGSAPSGLRVLGPGVKP